MNKHGIFYLILIGFCACAYHSKRAEIAPIDSVAVMVADCFFIEGEVYAKRGLYDMKDYTSVKYDSLFEKHGFTKEKFIKNVNYYFTHEKYAEQLMNKVDTIIEQRVAVLRDSLNVIQ